MGAAIRPYLDRFVRGSNGDAATDRIKLLKLLWDTIGFAFGGRHELHERNYADNYENLRIETLMAATATGDLGAMQDFVRNCMGDYDLSGWTAKDLINPDDINVIILGMRSRGRVRRHGRTTDRAGLAIPAWMPAAWARAAT